MTREQMQERARWIEKVRIAAGALEGFADRGVPKAAGQIYELAEACRWAASRLSVEAPAALPASSPAAPEKS